MIFSSSSRHRFAHDLNSASEEAHYLLLGGDRGSDESSDSVFWSVAAKGLITLRHKRIPVSQRPLHLRNPGRLCFQGEMAESLLRRGSRDHCGLFDKWSPKEPLHLCFPDVDFPVVPLFNSCSSGISSFWGVAGRCGSCLVEEKIALIVQRKDSPVLGVPGSSRFLLLEKSASAEPPLRP